jgi:hypothetical protein
MPMAMGRCRSMRGAGAMRREDYGDPGLGFALSARCLRTSLVPGGVLLAIRVVDQRAHHVKWGKGT